MPSSTAILDSGYLIPKPDKLLAADVNEPTFRHRVPGTVIYTRPCQRLKIHVWNTDDVPHSLHCTACATVSTPTAPGRLERRSRTTAGAQMRFARERAGSTPSTCRTMRSAPGRFMTIPTTCTRRSTRDCSAISSCSVHAIARRADSVSLGALRGYISTSEAGTAPRFEGACPRSRRTRRRSCCCRISIRDG